MTKRNRAAWAMLSGLTFLSGCVAPASDRGSSSFPPPPAAQYGPPQPLVGWDARRLIARFGEPRLDIRDRTVRKLQFSTGGCVLDVYLYNTGKSREPVVTHIDTRHPDGSDVDPSRCGIR